MNPQDLARAHENKLRNYCCKKCGGRLVQVYDQSTNEYKVVCGPNRCYPLEVETMHARTLRENIKACDETDKRKDHPKSSSLFQEEM